MTRDFKLNNLWVISDKKGLVYPKIFMDKEEAIQWGKETIDSHVKSSYRKHFNYLKKIIKSKVNITYRDSLSIA